MNTIDLEQHYLRMTISKTILHIYFMEMEDEELIEWFEDHPKTFIGYEC
jgi:hypothetical protein